MLGSLEKVNVSGYDHKVTSFCSSTGVSDLVVNPEDMFSNDGTHYNPRPFLFSGMAEEKENNSEGSDSEPLTPQNLPRRKGNKRRLNSLQSPLTLNNPPV